MKLLALIGMMVAWIAAGQGARAADSPDMEQLFAPVAQSRASAACGAGESWRFDDAIPAEERKDYQRFLAGKISPARGFSLALSYRRIATSLEARTFAEYWASRSLLSARMTHAAFGGLGFIASAKLPPRAMGVQLAAIQCLSRMVERLPSLELPGALMARLGDFPRGPVVWDLASQAFRQQLNQDAPAPEIERTIGWLRGSGLEESFARGVWAEKQGKHRDASAALGAVVAALKAHRPEAASLQRYDDQARLLLARAYYGNLQFDRALRELDGIRKQSNELSEALSELAWAALMRGSYSEAIGAAVNLQAGGLRRTFAPEGPMVTAMAMNELCQYPQALRATRGYLRAYERPFRWLSSWSETSREERLYPLVLEYLRAGRHRKSSVPERVESEWLRSPVFIASQEELNLWAQEKSAGARMSRLGSREEKAVAREILLQGRDLALRIRAARARQATYARGEQSLPPGLQARLAELRAEIAEYRNYRRAGAAWQGILRSQLAQAATRGRFLVERINRDLAARNAKMLSQLQDVAENNQLIEVEIYQGASQDMIWRNAHPDFKGVSSADVAGSSSGSWGKTWDWGHHKAGDDALSEVWEDELGSFKANVPDLCQSKSRYMALKQRHGSHGA